MVYEEEYTKLNKNLTIICPTYNRHNFLLRSRDYFYKFPFKVIYVDGSDFPCPSMAKSDINIDYYHVKKSFNERVNFALKKVKTKYICFIGDDDYLHEKGLSESIAYLENNNDYVSCAGICVCFNKKNGEIIIDESFINTSFDLSYEIPKERLLARFKEYGSSHFYAVTRKDIYSKSVEFINTIDLNIFAFNEYIHQFILLAFGKCKLIPCLFWIRSAEDVPTFRNSLGIGYGKQKVFDRWWADKYSKHIQEKEDFCNSLTKCLEGKITRDEIFQIFDIFYDFHERINANKHPILKNKALKPLSRLISGDLRSKIYSFIRLFQKLIIPKKIAYLSKKNFIEKLDIKNIGYDTSQLNLFFESASK